MTQYCANDPCDSEATHYYISENSARIHLCYTCCGAFELGQINPEADLWPVGEEPEWDEEE